MFPPEVIDHFDGWINDDDGWNRFARDYLRINLDEEQDEALYAIRHNPKVAIASGTSRGKDYLMAVSSVCFMYLTPEFDEHGKLIGNTKVVLTAPTGRQVKDIMRPEIARVWKGAIYLPGRLVGNDIRTPYEEWFLTGFKASDHDTEAWTGMHAVNIFIGVTEATGLPPLVFNAIEGNLQGNSRLVIVFNPNINTGYAASAMKSPEFKKIRLNSLKAPNVVAKKIIHPGQVDYDWVMGRIRDWCTRIEKKDMTDIEGDFTFEGVHYRPNDLFRAKILGQFPKVSEGVLIPQEWIEAADKRWKEMQTGNITTPQGVTGTPKDVAMQTKPLRLGVDVAGMGRDNSVFAARFGEYVESFISFNSGGEALHMEVAGKVKVKMQQHQNTMTGLYSQSMIDTIGEGAGVYSRLVEISSEKDCAFLKDRCHSAKFSEAATWDEQPLKDISGQFEFINMRAYLYWAVRDWLDPRNGSKAAIPPDDEFLQEATEIKWKFNSKGKIQIEEKEEIKKRLKRSPDKFDSLAETFWPVQDVDPRPAKRKNIAQFFH